VDGKFADAALGRFSTAGRPARRQTADESLRGLEVSDRAALAGFRCRSSDRARDLLYGKSSRMIDPKEQGSGRCLMSSPLAPIDLVHHAIAAGVFG